jgi:hypothetical protein
MRRKVVSGRDRDRVIVTVWPAALTGERETTGDPADSKGAARRDDLRTTLTRPVVPKCTAATPGAEGRTTSWAKAANVLPAEWSDDDGLRSSVL